MRPTKSERKIRWLSRKRKFRKLCFFECTIETSDKAIIDVTITTPKSERYGFDRVISWFDLQMRASVIAKCIIGYRITNIKSYG